MHVTIQLAGGCCVTQGAQPGALGQPGGGGGEAQEGADVGTLLADSCC